ncbi:hypothetical protein [Mesorhizobium xinjiangense]|uniref:hypothetical protein n=1 Tax=Mesorhizobium xinjiangense TaxID=2678685 RepID=UPI0012EEC71E|nr:hypothetical protein [Mesorhizobium xinjiangense]
MDPFEELRQMIESPSGPTEGAAGRARRLMLKATLGAPETDELVGEIDLFAGDYEMMIGTLEMTGPGGPMPMPGVNLTPIQDMLRARLERIMTMCLRSGTVH